MPTVATRGQGTPKELFTGSLYLWNRVPLPDSGPCLESSSSLFQVAGTPEPEEAWPLGLGARVA